MAGHANRQKGVRGGRPIRHTVKVTDEQEARLQALAAQQKVSVSRLLVETTLASPGWSPMARRGLMTGWLAARLELSGIARNVNQIAHWCNAQQRFHRDAESLTDDVERAIARFGAAIERVVQP